MRVVAAILASASLTIVAAPGRATDVPNFTFNVHVTLADVPANVDYAQVVCVVSGNGVTIRGVDQYSGIARGRLDRVMTVNLYRKDAVGKAAADVDPRTLKNYTCTLLIATVSAAPAPPSAAGMTAPNDGVVSGTLP